MQIDEEFQKEYEVKLVKIAKYKAEKAKFFDVLKQLYEEKDVMGAWVLGFVVGINLTLKGHPFALVTFSNFNNLVRRLKEGVTEEELIKELERVRKEGIMRDFTLYGGPP